MQRVVWLTDLHLNFLEIRHTDEFLARVAGQHPDVVLIGGDIAEAPTVAGHLDRIATRLACPIYFVLGNHDFYFGSIKRVRQAVQELCAKHANLIYLTSAGAISLSPSTGLCGDDGWADARLGDYERSLVMMNDYRLIEELAGANKRDRWPMLKAMGDAAARHVEAALPQALAEHEEVLFLTHVPPLREACWYQGQISNDEWLPHFTCLAVGEAILRIMRDYPRQRLTVLCGHTHSPGDARPLDNVRILTGGAEYGSPQIQRVFDV
ncbi:MAG TPA: metallophosphoesterase [Pirellulales bacterium]|jgi:Icc protein|nr:metallophosphoesterase [Pirellulales bacterium]